MAKITFLGAAQTVTGSRTSLEHHGKKFLIDCGLFQGPKEIRDQNWAAIPDAKSYDGVILTHAHIDHSGYIPKFVVDGFRGKIYTNPATYDLCKVMLPDSGRLQEEDARFANTTKYSHHDPALPLYTEADALKSLEHFYPVMNSHWQELGPCCSVKFLRAGHILGSSIVQFSLDHDSNPRLITFSGDLGNARSVLMKDPETVSESDYLVLESTYGDRVQETENIKTLMSNIIKKVVGRGGTLVIPAFAVGRTQEIIYIINQLEQEGLIPTYPVYLDSPMAKTATGVYKDHEQELKTSGVTGTDFNFQTHNFKMISSPDDSMLLCMSTEPKIVISAAGMLTGGRVLHHLKAQLPREESGVLFVGYQVQGTKGYLLKNGLRRIRIHHREIDVEAEIFSIETLSAHADSNELVGWVNQFVRKPEVVFLNHGEPAGLQALKYRLMHECGIKQVKIPTPGESFNI